MDRDARIADIKQKQAAVREFGQVVQELTLALASANKNLGHAKFLAEAAQHNLCVVDHVVCTCSSCEGDRADDRTGIFNPPTYYR